MIRQLQRESVNKYTTYFTEVELELPSLKYMCTDNTTGDALCRRVVVARAGFIKNSPPVVACATPSR